MSGNMLKHTCPVLWSVVVCYVWIKTWRGIPAVLSTKMWFSASCKYINGGQVIPVLCNLFFFFFITLAGMGFHKYAFFSLFKWINVSVSLHGDREGMTCCLESNLCNDERRHDVDFFVYRREGSFNRIFSFVMWHRFHLSQTLKSCYSSAFFYAISTQVFFMSERMEC